MEQKQPPPSAIHQVLGEAFDRLPPEVRAAHDHAGQLIVRGKADVETGPGWLRWLICAIIGLPRAGKDQDVTISLETGEDGIDIWYRNFNDRRYHSRLEAGKGRFTGKLIEHQGPMTNIFALEAKPDRLIFRLEQFAVLGIFLPRWLSPGCDAFESGRDGMFGFDITIDAPIVGRLIVYRGMTPITCSFPV